MVEDESMMSLSLTPAMMHNSFGKYCCSYITQKEVCAVMWTGRTLLWNTKPMRKCGHCLIIGIAIYCFHFGLCWTPLEYCK